MIDFTTNTPYNCLIFDFETLSQDPNDGVVLSLAMLTFDAKVFVSDSPYTFEQLCGIAKRIKFKVKEQVDVYHRKIDRQTLDWWASLPPEVFESEVKPSNDDVSIANLSEWMYNNVNIKSIKTAFTRGKEFDLRFLESICGVIKQECPVRWQIHRDTRSFIDGMTIGSSLKSDFMPPNVGDKFLKHDPIHDIVIDVMRMQYLIRMIILGVD